MEKKILKEHYLNLFVDNPKHTVLRQKYAEELYQLLVNSYKAAGGIKGKGLESPESMIKNIYQWKLDVKNGVILSFILYKLKNGVRKRVAGGSNGTRSGLISYMKQQKEDTKQKRSYGEISGKALDSFERAFDLKEYVIDIPTVKKVLKGDEISIPPKDDPEILKRPEMKDYFYQRNIGGELHTKLMVGDFERLKQAFNEAKQIKKAIILLESITGKKIELK